MNWKRCLLVILITCHPITIYAETGLRSKIESYIIQGYDDVSKNELKSMYKDHKLTKEELKYWLDFIDIDLLKNIFLLDNNYNLYITNKDYNNLLNATKLSYKVSECLSHKTVINNIKKYATREFITQLEYNIGLANDLVENIRKINIGSNINSEEYRMKRKTEDEKMAIAEGQYQEVKAEYRAKYISSSEIVKDSDQYQKLELYLNICCDSENKKVLELNLKKDMAYARKYGVVNTYERGVAVDQIKSYDYSIAYNKEKYKHQFSTPFKIQSCKKNNCERSSIKLNEYLESETIELMKESISPFQKEYLPN